MVGFDRGCDPARIVALLLRTMDDTKERKNPSQLEPSINIYISTSFVVIARIDLFRLG